MMSKRWIPLLLCIFSLLPLTSAAQSDAGEPTFAIPVLVDGEVRNDSFAQAEDARLYAFNGQAGDLVNISMEPEDYTQLNPYLFLLNDTGEIIAYNDDSPLDDAPIFAAAIVDAELPADGTYFVLATTYWGRMDDLASKEHGPHHYELKASGFTTTKTTAYAIAPVILPLNIDEPLPIIIPEATHWMPFAGFHGSAGEVINLETARGESGSIDTILYLFDSTGQRIAADDTAFDFDSITDFELPTDGTYLVVALIGSQVLYPDDELESGDFHLILSKAV